MMPTFSILAPEPIKPRSDAAARALRRIQEIVLEDCPWVLLHYQLDFSLVNERVLHYLPHNFPYGMEKHYRVRRAAPAADAK